MNGSSSGAGHIMSCQIIVLILIYSITKVDRFSDKTLNETAGG